MCYLIKIDYQSVKISILEFPITLGEDNFPRRFGCNLQDIVPLVKEAKLCLLVLHVKTTLFRCSADFCDAICA